MRKETGDDRWHAKKPVEESPSKLVLISLYRPMKVPYPRFHILLQLLIFSPIILSLAMYFFDSPISLQCFWNYLRIRLFAFHHVFIIYFLLINIRFPQVFGTVYGWSEGAIGLSYLGCGIGFFLGLFLVGLTNDRMVTRLTKRHGGVRKPEYRMSVMMFSTPLIAVGMFWYGWSAKAKTHW